MNSSQILLGKHAVVFVLEARLAPRSPRSSRPKARRFFWPAGRSRTWKMWRSKLRQPEAVRT